MKPLRTATLSTFALAATLVTAQAYAISDSSFMKDAAKAGASELAAAKLAQTKARRAEVKSFAAAMVKDHTAMAEELGHLASSKNVKLPDEGSLVDRAKVKLIDAGDDAKFDQRYVKSFGVKAHEDAIKLFEEVARDTKDADVRSFAQKSLPDLRHHLQMAQELEQAP